MQVRTYKRGKNVARLGYDADSANPRLERYDVPGVYDGGNWGAALARDAAPGDEYAVVTDNAVYLYAAWEPGPVAPPVEVGRV